VLPRNELRLRQEKFENLARSPVEAGIVGIFGVSVTVSLFTLICGGSSHPAMDGKAASGCQSAADSEND
jgi:hypothetical protein